MVTVPQELLDQIALEVEDWRKRLWSSGIAPTMREQMDALYTSLIPYISREYAEREEVR